LVAHLTSALSAEYFEWTDAACDTASGLARKFIRRFPELVNLGTSSGWLYTGLYLEMLHLTYPNGFAYAGADWDTPSNCLPKITIRGGDNAQIPLPPWVQYSSAITPKLQESCIDFSSDFRTDALARIPANMA
jgi:hypothetical protein